MADRHARCPRCDRPVATAELWETHGADGNGCECAVCSAHCWACAPPYGCTGDPVDWRARALAAEHDRDEAIAQRGWRVVTFDVPSPFDRAPMVSVSKDDFDRQGAQLAAASHDLATLRAVAEAAEALVQANKADATTRPDIAFRNLRAALDAWRRIKK